MNAIGSVGLWTAIVGCGLMAGVYFTFSSFLMGSLAAVPRPAGILAMQSINRVILSSLFMPVFFATSAVSLALAIWGLFRWGEPGAGFAIAGGLVYVLGMFVCTAAFNVPLNNALDVVEPDTAAAADLWTRYLRDWTRWNHVRTAASLGASGLFLAAARAMT